MARGQGHIVQLQATNVEGAPSLYTKDLGVGENRKSTSPSYVASDLETKAQWPWAEHQRLTAKSAA